MGTFRAGPDSGGRNRSCRAEVSLGIHCCGWGAPERDDNGPPQGTGTGVERGVRGGLGVQGAGALRVTDQVAEELCRLECWTLI